MSVALQSGRSAIGIDINQDFCLYVLEHLEDEK
jgi:DNA modification methylase